MVTNGFNFSLIPIGTTAQDWARLLNLDFSDVDYHNHTLGSGIRIDSLSLVRGDLNLNGHSVLNVTFLNFTQSAEVDEGLSLFVNPNGDLVYQTDLFTLPITSGSGLNIVPGTEGFTVVGFPPIAIFDAAALAIRFFSSTGANTSTLDVDTLKCLKISASSSFSAPDVPLDCVLTNTNTFTSTVNCAPYVTLPSTTQKIGVTSYIATHPGFPPWFYKVSESGAFYYDGEPFGTSVNYDISYFTGAKGWISSPNTRKEAKIGIRHFMKTVAFTITGLVTTQTYLLDDNLNNSNLVSFIPKILTTSGVAIGATNPLLQSITLPTFNVIFSGNSLSVAVDLDFSAYFGLFTSLILEFKIIYADRNYTITN